MTGQAKSLAVDSRVVHYLEAGIGPLVVLVHGSLSDQRYWSPQMQPLGALYRVVAPSLRHHHPGAPARHAPADYGVRQHAEDLVALVQALDAGAAHLVGHSRGAHVCAFAAIERPDLFASLALADPALRLGEDADPLTLPAERRDVIERIRRGDVDGGLEAFIDAVSGPGTWKRLNSRASPDGPRQRLDAAGAVRRPGAGSACRRPVRTGHAGAAGRWRTQPRAVPDDLVAAGEAAARRAQAGAADGIARHERGGRGRLQPKDAGVPDGAVAGSSDCLPIWGALTEEDFTVADCTGTSSRPQCLQLPPGQPLSSRALAFIITLQMRFALLKRLPAALFDGWPGDVGRDTSLFGGLCLQATGVAAVRDMSDGFRLRRAQWRHCNKTLASAASAVTTQRDTGRSEMPRFGGAAQSAACPPPVTAASSIPPIAKCAQSRLLPVQWTPT